MDKLGHEELVTLFLSLGVLLGTARILGEIAQRFRQPAVLGELLAGVLLGPSVLGILLPAWNAYLFPMEGASAVAREGFVTVAIVLFLLVAGWRWISPVSSGRVPPPWCPSRTQIALFLCSFSAQPPANVPITSRNPNGEGQRPALVSAWGNAQENQATFHAGLDAHLMRPQRQDPGTRPGSQLHVLTIRRPSPATASRQFQPRPARAGSDSSAREWEAFQASLRRTCR